MKLCNFQPYNNLFKCSDCAFVTKHKNAQRECVPLVVPSLSTRITNFTKAAIQHQLNGSPTCTDEQIKERLEICYKCPLFKINDNGVGGICTHDSCGCTIKDEQIYLNKLAWADQQCPINRWGPITPKNSENGV